MPKIKYNYKRVRQFLLHYEDLELDKDELRCKFCHSKVSSVYMTLREIKQNRYSLLEIFRFGFVFNFNFFAFSDDSSQEIYGDSAFENT